MDIERTIKAYLYVNGIYSNNSGYKYLVTMLQLYIDDKRITCNRDTYTKISEIYKTNYNTVERTIRNIKQKYNNFNNTNFKTTSEFIAALGMKILEKKVGI